MFEGLKGAVIALCCVAIGLLFYAASLPQYGDGAIGTVMVFAASFVAYMFLLVLALPLVIRAFRRGESIAHSSPLCMAIAAPLVAWMAVILWNGSGL